MRYKTQSIRKCLTIKKKGLKKARLRYKTQLFCKSLFSWDLYRV